MRANLRTAAAALALLSPSSAETKVAKSFGSPENEQLIRRLPQADTFQLAGLFTASTFTLQALEYCPPTPLQNNESRSNYRKAQCAISALTAIAAAVLTGFHQASEVEHQNDSRDLWARGTTGHAVGNWHVLTNEAIEPHIDSEGNMWTQRHLTMNHLEHDSNFTLTYAHHPETDRHMYSTSTDGSQDSSADAIAKRQDPSTYYAYYAWTNGNRDVYANRDSSEDGADGLVEDAYNYLLNNNVDQACANLYINGAQAFTGEVAVTNNQFTPQLGSC